MTDLIVVNARVLTMDAGNPRAEAVALAAGQIVAVGSRAEIEALAVPGTRVLDAGGGSVLPGFHEAHMHLFAGGAELTHMQLGGIHGQAALTRAVRDWAVLDPAPVILAQAADHGMLGAVPLSRAVLDLVLPDRPLLLIAQDHHTAWANTAALSAAGLLRGRATPAGTEVVMGPDGLASGELRESAAFGPILDLAGAGRPRLGLDTGEEPWPMPTQAERAADKATLHAGLAHVARYGITSVTNMDGNLYTLELLAEIETEGGLTARVKVPFHFKNHMEPGRLETASQMAVRWQGDWLSSGFVKLFLDGVIDSRTSVMLHDYADAPGWRGEPLFDPARFAELAVEIDRRGLQMAVHATGDRAVRIALDGYEAALRANGSRDARHRIEHVELIDPADVGRFADLGVVASMQPPHPPGAMDFPLEPTLTRIGPGRWPDFYATRTLLEAGARLAFASDWPISDVNPLRGIQAALTRQVWGPEGPDQRVGLLAALQAYTSAGAYAEHSEARKGMIRQGYLGDLVVLSADIEATAPAEIARLDIVWTICGGRLVYAAG